EKLVKIGVAALRPLRTAATATDNEVKGRAKRCIVDIEQAIPPGVPLAVVRMLLGRNDTAVSTVLLRYLPFAGNEEVEEEIAFGLDALAKNDAKVVAELGYA